MPVLYSIYIFPVYLKSVVNAFNELQRGCRHFKDCFKWERENERERNTEQFADKQVTMAKGGRKGASRGSRKRWQSGEMAKRENAKMRGKCVNDTEQFTIIASRVRGQPGSQAVWQSGRVWQLGSQEAIVAP